MLEADDVADTLGMIRSGAGGNATVMSRTTTALSQAALGAILLTAGTGHLTSKREEFRAQVPSWFPADPDRVVVVSGYVELALGAALLTTWRQPARRLLGVAVAGFFAGVFPGNIAQFVERRDGFGLDTDAKRALRLLGQPALIGWALAATRSKTR
jgi:uncharacterized membrane protein